MPDSIVKERPQRWYLGGLASTCATVVTHPLDLLKVHLQTQQQVQKGLVGMTVQVVKNHGILALYNGLSASLCRQLTYSTTRFGVYEVLKGKLLPSDGGGLPFYQKVLLGAAGGFLGVFVGNPFDVVNIRMQNDAKLPLPERRNYSHVFNGVRRIVVEEGATTLWKGTSLNVARGVLMTVGQIAFYEQIKQWLLQTSHFKDNMVTHFTASLGAGTIATAMTQPVDVMKTRMMNAKPGEFKSIMHCFWYTAKTGPVGFFKGFLPAFVRLGPHTILTFMFLEQFRKLLPAN